MKSPKVVLLVVENRDSIPIEYAKFLAKTAWDRSVARIQFWQGKRAPVWFMRRKMMKNALDDKEITHVLSIDTDVIPDKGYLEGLLSHDLPMVSGVYWGADGGAINRLAGKPFFIDAKVPVILDTFSMGLSLIKREVLEKIEYPKPDYEDNVDADIEFCRLAKEAGYPAYCDFGVRGTHILRAMFKRT